MARKKRRKSGAAPQAIRRAAIRIADAEGMVRSVSKSRWEVASRYSPGSWHMVAIADGGIACDCPDGANRGGAPCKHSVAIEIILLRGAETIQSGETTLLEEPGGLLHQMRINQPQEGRDPHQEAARGRPAVQVPQRTMRGPVHRRTRVSPAGTFPPRPS